MKITRYFPGFASDGDDEPTVAEFNSVDELMEIEWVKSWTQPIPWAPKHPSATGYSVSDGTRLMAEFHNPREWWVVGFFDKPYELGLPEFVAK